MPNEERIYIMPNLNNAKKALRQAKKRADRNLVVKTAYKKAIKIALKAIAEGEKDVTEKIRMAQKTLDKATKRGVIKANTASRKLSRLMKKVNVTAK